LLWGQSQGHDDRNPNDPFTLKPLAGNVYCLYGRGGNVGFFVGPDAVFVIDSQFRDLAPGIVDQIKSVTDKPVKYLLNTHHHFDHTGGNEFFLKFAVVIAQDNVRKHMLASPQQILKDYPKMVEDARKQGNTDRVKMFEEQIEWAKKIKIEEIPAPFMTFNSELHVYLGGETINVWHTPPSHTDGDSVVYFEKAKVVHLGDLGWNKVIPVIDIEGGGSVKGYIGALDLVMSRIPTDAVVIPGHGEIMDVQGIKILQNYIRSLMDLATKAKSAGKSKEDFVAAVELPEFKDWKGYPDRFKLNAASAYDEVSSKP
jgi:cyclase